MNKKTSKKKAPYSKEQYLDWYLLMLRIRRFEERAQLEYGKNIRGFLHLYIGQEAVAAGIESAIRPEDALITAYRQHGNAIARGISLRAAMAELFGRMDGVIKGKGGSMHFFSAEHRYFGGHGIVGAQIGLGTGIALAEKYKGTDNLCVTMFGDGAARQGILHESFNMASKWELPVLYIVENNHYAMGTSVQRTSKLTDLHHFGEAYGMPSEKVNGMEPEPVYEAVSKAAEYIRAGKGPYFLEIETYRYKGHSISDPAKYRSKEELAKYRAIDPLKTTEAKLLQYGFATEDDIKAIKAQVKEEIEDAVAFAKSSPLPPPEELFKDEYVEDDYPFLQ